MNSVLRYVFDLGFSSSSSTAPPLGGDTSEGRLPYLGGKNAGPSLVWDLYSWFSMASGIFLRSGIQLPKLTWEVNALTWQSFLAAAVVSFAAFGAFMRWFNKGGKRGGLQLFSTPFTFGFLLSLGEFGVKNLISRHI